jgi:predicted RND superfamily exporter protein
MIFWHELDITIIFIGLLFFYYSLVKRSKKYYRDNAKKNYEADKKIRQLYRNMESHPGESYSKFKNRIKKSLG